MRLHFGHSFYSSTCLADHEQSNNLSCRSSHLIGDQIVQHDETSLLNIFVFLGERHDQLSETESIEANHASRGEHIHHRTSMQIWPFFGILDVN